MTREELRRLRKQEEICTRGEAYGQRVGGGVVKLFPGDTNHRPILDEQQDELMRAFNLEAAAHQRAHFVRGWDLVKMWLVTAVIGSIIFWLIIPLFQQGVRP